MEPDTAGGKRVAKQVKPPDGPDERPSGVLSKLTLDDLWPSLFENLPVAYSLLDLETQEVTVNRACRTLLGYAPDDPVDIDVQGITHPDDRSFTADYHRRLVDGEIDHFETDKRYLRK